MKRFTPPVVCIILVALPGGSDASAPARAADPPDRPWIERVERDRDRSAGRIVDDSTWELHRIRERADERLGRLRERRDFERLDEERDRQLQLEARSRRSAQSLIEGDGGSVILSEPPGAGGVVLSPMAAQAEADERALAAAKDKLERSLRGVNVAEQRSLRTLRRRLNREGRAGEFEQRAAPVRAQHETLRAGHRGDYERTRSRILGRP
jgi:hypothetical protein